jgi:hypothetical protein
VSVPDGGASRAAVLIYQPQAGEGEQASPEKYDLDVAGTPVDARSTLIEYPESGTFPISRSRTSSPGRSSGDPCADGHAR